MDAHVPVMVEEVVRTLDCHSPGIYVDGTVGSGGHTRAMLEASAPEGRILAIDRDEQALEAAQRNLAEFGPRVIFHWGEFGDLEEILREEELGGVNGILFDLGFSSLQLAPERGLSYRSDGPLDMRMDRHALVSAARLLNTVSQPRLEAIIRDYGEERWARKIARNIVQWRERERIETTQQLVKIVRQSLPHQGRADRSLARVFQALRIAVNDELKQLQEGLGAAAHCLRKDGRLCVISYHSLEDRIVKHFLRQEPGLVALTRRPLRPTEAEVSRNLQSRSARLRAARQI